MHEHQNALTELGWGDDFQAAFAPHTADGHHPARVGMQSHGLYRLLSPQGEHRAELAGRLHHAFDTVDHPAVVAPRVASVVDPARPSMRSCRGERSSRARRRPASPIARASR